MEFFHLVFMHPFRLLGRIPAPDDADLSGICYYYPLPQIWRADRRVVRPPLFYRRRAFGCRLVSAYHWMVDGVAFCFCPPACGNRMGAGTELEKYRLLGAGTTIYLVKLGLADKYP